MVHYKWIALSNTTLGALMATIDSSILIISLPAIFKGMGVNPLVSGNTGLLLWLLLGYMITSSVVVVTIGRLSDMFGRVRIYNLGFLIFAIASTIIYIVSYATTGDAGVTWLIFLRLVQGLGGGFLIANSAAIITDAFPENERGKAMGINQIAAIGGSILGLLVGGVLAAIDWHLIFLISVPVGIVGAIWAYLALKELATIRKEQHIDMIGNIAFAVGITLILIAMTYGLQPYGGSSMGWSSPYVEGAFALGLIFLLIFAYVETKARDPMFRLWLFRIRAFAAGCASMLLAGIARGGLQFMLVIWLQGIWLPLHGVNFADTPFYAAIDMIPLVAGFLVAGPISGYLSDRYGARLFTTGGMLLNTLGFLLLATMPANFSYTYFGLVIFAMGIGQGMFAAPNTASIMSSVPPEYRGAASGMRATLMNVSFMSSITLFFTFLAIGVSANLPGTLYNGLVAQNVSSSVAQQISQLPPTSALFSALLGYNPMKTLLPANVINTLPVQNANVILGNSFFPNLIEGPFIDGMHIVFAVGAALTFLAAVASLLRGGRYVHKTMLREDEKRVKEREYRLDMRKRKSGKGTAK